MDLNEAITGRRAVREFTTETVDDSSVTHLIDAAIQAPSAMNEQPWIFTVLRNQKILNQISEASKALLLKDMSASLNSDQFQSQLKDPDFQIFYHAPVLILISANSDGPEIIEDCSLAAENLMLTASASGLGTCWIGLAQKFLNSLDGKRLLGTHPESVSVAPIIIGHPKSSTPAVIRKKPEILFID
jgi:nitroreductase